MLISTAMRTLYPAFHRFSLFPLLVLPFFLLTLVALVTAETKRSDIIGDYVLHPDTALLADPAFCPENITTATFNFGVSPKPARLDAPDRFNILVPHLVTTLSGRACESTGTIAVVENSHPFASDPMPIIDTWARAGWGPTAGWINLEFSEAVAKQAWNVGFDFVERSCVDVMLRPGVGFLWFQPGWNLRLGSFTVTGNTKFLFLTFQGKPRNGCVYTAERVGGDEDLEAGPVSDESVETAGGEQSPPDESDVVFSFPSVPPTATSEVDGDGEEQEEEDIFGDAEEGEGGEDDEDSGSVFGNAEDNDAIEDESDDSDDTRSCFPAAALVELHDGGVARMDELDVGHHVLAAGMDHSTVFFFSHRARASKTLHEFVSVRAASGAQVELSAGHYMHVGGQLVAAGAVREGDVVTLRDGTASRVEEVRRVQRAGKFAPHTMQGDIVVNGVLVSTYTTAVHPRLAHGVLLAPLRALYRAGLGRVFDGVLDNGAERWGRLVPGGPLLARTVA